MKTQQIPIDQIDPNPHQPRSSIKAANLKELADSIKDVGIIQPLLVTQRDDRYILVAGFRRLEASKQVELKDVPCMVQDLSDDDMIRYALIENIQREDLNPLEEALAIKQLIGNQGLDYRKVAEMLGKSKTYVGERLALLDLPDDLKEAVSQGTLSMKKADALKKVNDDKARARLIGKASAVDLQHLKVLIEKAQDKLIKGRKPRESWDVYTELREFSKSTEGVRLYKDRISFRFDTEESLHDLLIKVLELLEEEVEEV